MLREVHVKRATHGNANWALLCVLCVCKMASWQGTIRVVRGGEGTCVERGGEMLRARQAIIIRRSKE